ncbi:MAG TPA: hypothetical protein VMQ51_08135 [Candidatus Binatia bacterium]|nr:hypothetical protein [Candidatus Binatia bacterium]
MKGSSRSPKAGRPPVTPKPRVKAALRRGTTLVQSTVPRRVESRMAPLKRAERHHARPGAGIKRSRANTTKRS